MCAFPNPKINLAQVVTRYHEAISDPVLYPDSSSPIPRVGLGQLVLTVRTYSH
jgi:hypothetical protein